MQTGTLNIFLPRRVVLTSLAASFTLAQTRLGWAQDVKIPADIELKVSREGSEIGRHRVQFRPTENGFEAQTNVDLEIKAALITFFRYEQQSVDLWENGVLVKSSGTCDDDGDITSFEAWRENDELVFEGKLGRNSLPLGAMTDLCFWNPAILETANVIDAQTAEIDPMEVKDLGPERLEIAGQTMETNRYFAGSGETRNGDIWYDASGRWVKASFNTRGELLEFELVN